MTPDDAMSHDAGKDALRRRAEEVLRRLNGSSDQFPRPQELSILIHEFSVQQAELQMRAGELRKSAEELTEAKRRFFQCFEAAPLPVFRFAPDGSILEMNLAASELVEAGRKTTPKAADLRFEQFLRGDQLDLWKRTLAEAAAITEPIRRELRLTDSSGSVRYFVVSCLGHVREDPPHLIAYLIETTEVHRYRSENERLSLLARHTGNAVIFTDRERRIIWTNEAFTSTTGYMAEEVLGKSPSLLQGAETDPQTMRSIREALNGDGFFKGRILNYTKSGAPYWNQLEVFPMRDDAGTITGFMSIQHDVTGEMEQNRLLARLQQALEQSASTIVITDRNGAIEYVNPAFEITTGYSKEEVIGKKPSILKSGEQNGTFYRDLWKTISSGRIWKGRFHNQDKWGNLFWEEATISPVLDEKGLLSGYIAVKENITRIVETDEELIRLNQRNDQILRSAKGVGVIAVNPDGIITFFSPGAEYLLGYSAEEMLGKATPAVIHLETEMTERGRQLSEELRREIAGIEVFTAIPDRDGSETREWTYVRKDGTRFPVSLAVSPQFGAKGELVGYQGVAQDLSEIRRAEQILHEKEMLLDVASRIAGLGGWELDLTTMEVTWTHQTHLIHEVPPDYRPTLENALDFYPLSARSLIKEGVERAMEDGNPWEMEVPFVTATGRHLWVRVQGLAERIGGRIVKLLGVIQDITEQKQRSLELERARNEALSANKAKGEFLSNMSHEIRTPLNAIIGMAELLDEDIRDPELKERLRTIHTSGDILLGLINDILDFSKIEARKIQIESIPLDLGVFLRELEAMIGPLAMEKALRFEVSSGSDLPGTIVTDPLRLRQILLNLLMNAVKFTERGEVSLNVARRDSDQEGPSICFSVRDTGIGMDVKTLGSIFHVFTQADSSTSRRFGGSGLGLAISKQLARLMGGDIIVRSAPGEGSEFSLRIPLRGTAEEAPPKTSPDHALSGEMEDLLGTRCPMRIILAEDNKINQQVATMMLSRLGYDPRVANNGAEVLNLLEQGPADLILMDVQMPVMSGLQATEKIMERYPPALRPQIVALTANASPEDKAICLQAGMTGYLIKPIRRKQLESAITEAFRRM